MLKQEEIDEFVNANPCVENWLLRLEETTRWNYQKYFFRFYRWLQRQDSEYAGLTPKQLLDQQDKTVGQREKFKLLTQIQQWIQSTSGRAGTKQLMYTAIRSFFMHNHVALPKDITFRIKGDKPPVETELTIDDLRKIIVSSNNMYQAVFLCMFQGSMGCNEFRHFNRNGWPQIKPQLEDEKQRLKVSLPGRKRSKNKRGFYTFIGKDAVQALRKYLASERGKIKNGEAIFVNSQGKPVNRQAIERYFRRHAFEQGVIQRWTPQCPTCKGDTHYTRRRGRGPQPVIYVCNKCGLETPASKIMVPADIRYKVHPHEMRDTFRSEWDLSPSRSTCAEFFMGHDIDPNDYNKVMRLNPDWAEHQYSLAEPFLNIMSEDPRRITVDRLEAEVEKRVQQRLANEHGRLEKLERELQEMRAQLKEMLEKKG